MGTLEFIPATRPVLRHLASKPQDFADDHGVHLHEVAQSVAQHSLDFMRTFSIEISPDWFGHFAVDGQSQEMVGVCSLKGPPVDGVVEIAFFTFPGFEGRGIGTGMARFALERACKLPGVKQVIAHTAPERNASTRILEKIGMTLTGEVEEDGAAVWLWETTPDGM